MFEVLLYYRASLLFSKAGRYKKEQSIYVNDKEQWLST